MHYIAEKPNGWIAMLSNINCAASFLDNFRQVSMADRPAWHQRSSTRNALAVVKSILKQPRDQLKHLVSNYQNRYDELVSRTGYRIAALLHRLLLFPRIIHLLLNVFP